MASPDWTGALERAQAHAPFLSRAIDRLPGLVDLLAAGDSEGALAYARRAGEDAPDVPTALRRERGSEPSRRIQSTVTCTPSSTE